MSEIIKQIKPVFEEKVYPIVNILNRINVSPNLLTVFGVLFVAVGSYFLYLENFLISALFLALGNLCDALDGTLARRFGKTSLFGAFLDSVIDRISDFLPLIALALVYKNEDTYLLIILVAIAGSFLVSYTRARGEGLGIKCSVGVLERAERSILLILFVFLHLPILAVVIIAIGSIITTIQRVYCIYNKTKK